MNTKGLGFSMDAAPPWFVSALFQDGHDWAQGPARACGTDPKRNRKEYLMLLDIMAEEFYPIQELYIVGTNNGKYLQ